MKKPIVRIISFCILLILILIGTYKVFSFKYSEGNQILVDFYRVEKNTVDVLILGSSHAYTNYNNGTLWDDYGITSYNLGSSEQPLWNTYYYLKEALKHQQPKLIILEGFGTAFNFDYSADTRVIKNIFGMRWNKNRIDALKASVKKEDWNYLFFDYTRFHSRYSSLNKGDFFPDSNFGEGDYYPHFKGLMGQCLVYESNPLEIPDFSDVTEPLPLWEKTAVYYEKILDLADEENIPVAVIVTPYQISEMAHRYYLSAAEIAEEHGAMFLDATNLIDEIGIDLEVDYADSAHFNAAGSVKWTRFVGDYITSNFDLPDHRGDEKYSAWENTAELTRRYIAKAEILNCEDITKMSELIGNSMFSVIITSDGYFENKDPELLEFLSKQGIDSPEGNYIWVRKTGADTWATVPYGAEYYERTKDHDILTDRQTDADGNFFNTIVVDNENLKKVANGINVLVFDPYTDVIVDSFGVDVDSHSLVR